MSDFLKALFSENGSVSMMRVMSIICCIAAVAIAFVGLNKAVIDYSGISLLCSTFLGAAMGGKVLQKRIEVDGARSANTVEMRGSAKQTPDNPDA